MCVGNGQKYNYCSIVDIFVSWGSSEGIVFILTNCLDDRPNVVRLQERVKEFTPLHTVQTGCGTYPVHIICLLGIKQP
jgi:hypothetical protein